MEEEGDLRMTPGVGGATDCFTSCVCVCVCVCVAALFKPSLKLINYFHDNDFISKLLSKKKL